MTHQTQAETDAPLRILEQNHARIQEILRNEVNALRHQLHDQFQEIATLCARLDMAEAQRLHSNDISRILSRARQYHPVGTASGAGRLPPVRQQRRVLQDSALFDADWYVRAYGMDGGKAATDPGTHYLRIGAFEGRDPGPTFSSMQYYMANEDVALAGWPALVHYEMRGRDEDRPLTLLSGAGLTGPSADMF